MAKVSIKNNSMMPHGTMTEIDGAPLKGVVSIDYHVSLEEVPTFVFKTYGIPDIEVEGKCDFAFTVETIQEAKRVLSHSLQTNRELYDEFVSDIESAMQESTVVWEEWEYHETAKLIADRIIGNESTSR